jgi:ferredoxin
MAMTTRLALDPTACTGHGLCADLLPELVRLDEWGYPILLTADVPPRLASHARRAVRACPTLALRLARTRAVVTGSDCAAVTGSEPAAGTRWDPWT